MKVGDVQNHQSRKIEGGGRRDDLAPKASFYEQRKAPGMVKVCMRKKDNVDGGGIEAEGSGIFFVEFTAALNHSTVDQDALSRAFDQVAGAGDVLSSAMKTQLHDVLVSLANSGVPFISYQRRMPCHISSAESAYQNSSRSSGSMTPSSTRKSGSNAFFQ